MRLRKSRVDRLVRGLELEEEAGPAVLDQDRLTDNVQAVLRVTDPERNRFKIENVLLNQYYFQG